VARSLLINAKHEARAKALPLALSLNLISPQSSFQNVISTLEKTQATHTRVQRINCECVDRRQDKTRTATRKSTAVKKNSFLHVIEWRAACN
jgi:hypothetical protein